MPEAHVADPNYPSTNLSHRRADIGVHLVGLVWIVVASSFLFPRAVQTLQTPLILAVIIYVLAALASNLASWAYHLSPWHDARLLLRRIDHAAIYPSITGTFTVFFVQANTTQTLMLLCICWALTILAMWNKITNENVKSRWSTASYLGLGAIGLLAIPDMTNVPAATPYSILAGAACYVIGTLFYARKTMPYRYSIWHVWVNLGGVMMFIGVWFALF